MDDFYSRKTFVMSSFISINGQFLALRLKALIEVPSNAHIKLGGSGNGNALAQTDYYIEKDENGKDAKLCVFASRTGSGFVICEFPIKQEEE